MPAKRCSRDFAGGHGDRMAGMGWPSGARVGRDGQAKAELIAFLVLQVLYKTAWSESMGRDCAAYCAKKWV